jgi:hypothetical protein
MMYMHDKRCPSRQPTRQNIRIANVKRGTNVTLSVSGASPEIDVWKLGYAGIDNRRALG